MSAFEEESVIPGTILYVCNLCQEFGISRELVTQHLQDKHSVAAELLAANIGTYVVESTDTEHQKDTPQSLASTATNGNKSTEIFGDDQKLWTADRTKIFIDLVKEHQNNFENYKKKDVWEKICKILRSITSAHYTAVQCDTKWKGLLRTYKDIKSHNATSGKERRPWEFFEAMNDFLCKKPEITPVATCSSHEGLIVAENSEQSDDGILVANKPDKSKARSESSFQRKRKVANPVERRHKEKIERLDRYLDIFGRLVDKLYTKKRSGESSESE